MCWPWNHEWTLKGEYVVKLMEGREQYGSRLDRVLECKKCFKVKVKQTNLNCTGMHLEKDLNKEG